MDGRKIRAGALLRSDSHERLTIETVHALRSGAVSRVVDLRWAWECAANPSPFAGDGIYRHAPMLNDVLPYAPPPDSYAPMLDHNRPRIGQAFRAVAEAPAGGVLVHCQAGRDRTGVLVALLLTVAGVAAQDVADDYAVTDACTAQTMLNTLAHLDQRHGGIAAYLMAAGVEPGLVAAVRSRLLE